MIKKQSNERFGSTRARVASRGAKEDFGGAKAHVRIRRPPAFLLISDSGMQTPFHYGALLRERRSLRGQGTGAGQWRERDGRFSTLIIVVDARIHIIF